MKGIAGAVLGIGALFALVIGGVSMLVTSSANDIARSIADIEQARAFREAAAANHAAVNALGAVTILDRVQGILMILMIIALIVMVGYIYYMNLQIRQMREDQNNGAPALSSGKWAPGPNAGWRKVSEAAGKPTLPQVTIQDSLALMAITMMSNTMNPGRQQPINAQQNLLPPQHPTAYEQGIDNTQSDWDSFIRQG